MLSNDPKAVSPQRRLRPRQPLRAAAACLAAWPRGHLLAIAYLHIRFLLQYRPAWLHAVGIANEVHTGIGKSLTDRSAACCRLTFDGRPESVRKVEVYIHDLSHRHPLGFSGRMLPGRSLTTSPESRSLTST